MKTYSKISLLFFIMNIPLNVVFSQEILSFLDGAVSFQRPPGITLREESPNFDNVLDQSNYWRGKIRLNVAVYDTKALKNHPPTLFSESVYDLVYNRGYISRNGLLELFKSKTDFVISNYNPRSSIRMSYRLLTYHGISIGEKFFHTAAFNLDASLGAYGYTTNVIVDNHLVCIYLTFWGEEYFNTSDSLSAYFVLRNNKPYWKDDKTITAFYEDLSSGKYRAMPGQLQQLREAHDLIINSLTIRQDGGKMEMVEVIKPELVYKRTHITTDNVRLREQYRTSAPAIVIIPKDTDVQLLQIGSKETIDGITAPWVLIATDDGYVGWCFSGYLREMP